MFIHPTPELLPPTLEPATYFATVERYGLDDTLDFAAAASLTLTFEPGTSIAGVFEVLSNGSLSPVVPLQLDEALGLVVIEIDHNGTFVAAQRGPAPVPLPSWATLALAAGLAAVGAGLVARRAAGLS